MRPACPHCFTALQVCADWDDERGEWVCHHSENALPDYEREGAEPDDFGEDDNEPVGSCDECGSDIYPTDLDDALCDQCLYYAERGDAEPDEDDDDEPPEAH
ncbi:hypothetical protein R5W24_004462 [Gemmata sp. JC717]|uniref:hypothetical protein n=1 Tax=Gemmata algarum TaxID=2975278 RepID=UPI0021BADA68|nr:hypothetical protein [Gemmata algarum]MDY3555320.1 hypothetical protein [Gemmata algarum]